MGLTVTLTGRRLTDSTEGRLSLTPRVAWYVTSGVTNLAPGPMFFKITTAGGLTTIGGAPAEIVPTYDTNDNMTFTPEGPAYLARINISGHEILETWTVDGAIASVDWATLGIKPSPSDRITYATPLTVDSPVRHYASSGTLPAGDYEGSIVYLEDVEEWWGYSPTDGWHRVSD